jgi:rhodanese-related sulfurtransferase
LRFKSNIYEQFARIGKAISSPKRLELLDILSQGERTVEALAGEANLSVANTSQHLQVLRESQLVESRKEGLYVSYRLANMNVALFLQSIKSLAGNRFAELEWIMNQYLEGKEDLEPIDRDELIERIEEGVVTVIDVRPEEEFNAGHIPGATSIPLKELEDRISEIPEEKEIVAYCRGQYCILAIEAVALLRSRGYRAIHFEEGIPEWRSQGLPVRINVPGDR